MSHAAGEVLAVEDGERLGWFEYNGTVDFVCGRVYFAEEEMHQNWRTLGNHSRCENPEHEHALVILYSHYGGGFYWLGKVCWKCMAITDGFSPGSLSGVPSGFRKI